jgi:hypothetical protein
LLALQVTGHVLPKTSLGAPLDNGQSVLETLDRL